MNIIAQNKRYLPHEIVTRVKSVEAYRQTKDWRYVCRKYKISKASLMRWNKAYNGSRESLADKSHRPHRQHPNLWRNYEALGANGVFSDIHNKFMALPTHEEPSTHNDLRE